MTWAKRLQHGLLLAGGAIFGTAAAYLLAAWIGSTLPASAHDARLPTDAGGGDVTIWVESNGVHTGLIVPLVNEHADFSAFADPADARAAPAATTHMLVGWGHAGVYRDTPRWSDLDPADALSAVIGSNDTLLHVTFMAEPRQPNAWQRRVRISAPAYRRLARRITGQFVDGGRVAPAYGSDDVFYEATGRYSAFNTCNVWTGVLLSEAGVPMGRWTPFAGGVMKWLPAAPAAAGD